MADFTRASVAAFEPPIAEKAAQARIVKSETFEKTTLQ
jgi:hypothetical protein